MVIKNKPELFRFIANTESSQDTYVLSILKMNITRLFNEVNSDENDHLIESKKRLIKEMTMFKEMIQRGATIGLRKNKNKFRDDTQYSKLPI